MSTVTYLDACPKCPPGLPDPAPATGFPEHTPAGLVTNHQCACCGTAWSALRRWGWVIDRLVAPVPAEMNRVVLESSTRKGEAA